MLKLGNFTKRKSWNKMYGYRCFVISSCLLYLENVNEK